MSGKYPLIEPDYDYASQRKVITVDVDELQRSFRLRKLSSGQMREIESDVAQQLALSIVDENNERIYKTPERIQVLREMSQTATRVLLDAYQQLNGFNEEAVKETTKNSVASPPADSDGGSLAT